MTESTTTHVVDLGARLIIVRNVPCLKCEQCGEIAYIGTVAKQLEGIVEMLQTAMTEIAVVNYADKVA